jgi:hypothetical protein
MKYKEGDWVVIEQYDKYPVQLEQSQKLGYIDHLYSGAIFIELDPTEAKEAGVFLELCVRDPRNIPGGTNLCRGWINIRLVRPATKKDFSPLIKAEKDSIKRGQKAIKMGQKAIKMYEKVINNL